MKHFTGVAIKEVLERGRLMKKKVLELEIDAAGRIRLPEFLIRRLCLGASDAVPLVATNDKGYFMPSAFSAILLESGLSGNETTGFEKPAEQNDNDHELSDEEIAAACKELRKAMNLHSVLCPLEDDTMTLTPEVMEKLDVSAGDKVYVIKLDNFFYLCGPQLLREHWNEHDIEPITINEVL